MKNIKISAFLALVALFILFGASCKRGVESTSPEGAALQPPEQSQRVSSQRPIVLESTPTPPPPASEKPPVQPESLAPSTEAVTAIPAPELGRPEEGAKEPSIPKVQPAPSILPAKSNIEIILDTSGSMSGPVTSSSLSKLDSLKETILTVLEEVAVEDLPRNIGIRTFGKGCEDTQAIFPLGAINVAEIKKQIEKLTPEGESPIYKALAATKSDFDNTTTGDRIVLLIADGADSCQPNLCEMVSKLRKEQGEILIEVIGFDLDEKASKELECVAKEGGGKFWHARNTTELFSFIEEAINIGVPYNLKLKVSSGATPIPCKIGLYKAGTDMLIKETISPGIKHFSLTPGAYDIKIEYTDTKEATRPAKFVKGIEILEGSKIEQKVEFELAPLSLSALDETEKNIQAKFEIFEAGKENLIATIEETGPVTYFFTPGTYDIRATRSDQPAGYSIDVKGVELTQANSLQQVFRFQPGTIKVSGKTAEETPISFLCQVVLADNPEVEVSKQQIPQEGLEIKLLPGKYTLNLTAEDPRAAVQPRTSLNVEVEPAKTTEAVATFTLVGATFSALVSTLPLPATFTILDQKTSQELGRVESADGKPVKTLLPAGEYQVRVESSRSMNQPKPSLTLSNIKADPAQAKPLEITAKFTFGGLRLRGRDSKERPVTTEFTVYSSGTDEVVVNQLSLEDWLLLDLSPGTYDITASKVETTISSLPTVRLNDIKVEEGKITSHEAIFTTGKIKLIGRGINNELITCHFKIFQYGADRELINGTTGNDWQSYEIEPGKYYIEASYHDPDQAVTLKKWINITVGENEIVEKVLRF